MSRLSIAGTLLSAGRELAGTVVIEGEEIV